MFGPVKSKIAAIFGPVGSYTIFSIRFLCPIQAMV